MGSTQHRKAKSFQLRDIWRRHLHINITRQDMGQSGKIIKERQKEGSSPKEVAFAQLSRINKISMRTKGKDISDPWNIMGP